MAGVLRVLVITVVLLSGALAQPAAAAVSVSRAELKGSELRVEGTAAPSRSITVDEVPMGTSDAGGAFRIQRSGYTPPADCTVDVDDGSLQPRTATLRGCTVSAPPPPPPPASPAALSGLTVSPTSVTGGATSTGTVSLTSAAPAGGLSVALSSNWQSVATVPASVTVPAGSTTAQFTVSTSPVAALSSVTLTGSHGDVSRTATLTVNPAGAEGLYFITEARLPDAVVGQPYLAYIVSSDPPGPSEFRFKVVSGSVPPGTRFLRNTLDTRPEARLSGTPTAAGTSTFTVQVSDGTGATAQRTFTVVTVSAG